MPKKFGYIRSIGVCNFLPEHLERLKKETGILPTVNQIELHPLFNQEEQLKFHEEHHIATESWSPLSRASDLLQDETLQKVADQHNRTISQIILRWHYQLGAIAIPKSASPVRQKENISIFDFELSNEEMTIINILTKADGRLKDQDPAVYEEF